MAWSQLQPYPLLENEAGQPRTRSQHRKFAPGLMAFITEPIDRELPCSVRVRDSENPDNNVQFCGIDRTPEAAQIAAEYFARDVIQQREDARFEKLLEVATDEERLWLKSMFPEAYARLAANRAR